MALALVACFFVGQFSGVDTFPALCWLLVLVHLWAIRTGDALVHHPARVVIDHRCTEGVDVTFGLYTTAAGQVTAGDAALAEAISAHARGRA